MSTFAEGIAEDLAERLAPAVQEVTDRIRDDIKDAIDEAFPPASEPGTPPHRRTGDYQASQQSEEVTITPESVHGAAFTDEQLGDWLEHGTSRMEARPHYAPIAEEWDRKIVDEIKSAM